MYIEMKKTGLDVSDLITLVQRKGGGNTGFPYKSFVCRCSNCLYSTKGKCALKECCCMDERIRAHTCTFGEMMRYCFSGVGDTMMSDVIRGLIGVVRGDDMEVYWGTTALKFADYQREQLKAQANAVPRKVRKLSMALLFCFILIYVAVLGQVLLTSMGTLF